MEGTNSVETSGCVKRPKNSGEEEQTDWITEMPDSIPCSHPFISSNKGCCEDASCAKI